MTWTAKKVEELKRRWNAGETGAEIADAMRVTRNGVMGKLDRLGLLGSMPEEERSERTSRAMLNWWRKRLSELAP